MRITSYFIASNIGKEGRGERLRAIARYRVFSRKGRMSQLLLQLVVGIIPRNNPKQEFLSGRGDLTTISFIQLLYIFFLQRISLTGIQ